MRIFKEEQRFNQLWLIILMVVSIIMPIGIILGTYIKNPKSYSTTELIGLLGLVVFAACIIFFFKLSTRIDQTGIYYKFFPFHLKYKHINWSEINKVYVRTYDAINDYGGWGLRGGALWNKSKGKAINISGDIGIQLDLINGKKLLIGTQKKVDAERVLLTYKSKIKKSNNV
ncbi:hypothetical protein [Winogradskyella sp. PE311]|uniref:hypothetical protein n=1 Tax=Winogradskyella sp. PE311 TaxID=3366943 RepID=UPI0039808438